MLVNNPDTMISSMFECGKVILASVEVYRYQILMPYRAGDFAGLCSDEGCPEIYNGESLGVQLSSFLDF